MTAWEAASLMPRVTSWGQVLRVELVEALYDALTSLPVRIAGTLGNGGHAGL